MHAEQLDWAGPKVIEGMSNEEYHARPELSSTQLKPGPLFHCNVPSG